MEDFGQLERRPVAKGRFTIVAGDLDTPNSRPYVWGINERDNSSRPCSAVFHSRTPFHGSILCGQGSFSRGTNLPEKEKDEPSICSHLKI